VLVVAVGVLDGAGVFVRVGVDVLAGVDVLVRVGVEVLAGAGVLVRVGVNVADGVMRATMSMTWVLLTAPSPGTAHGSAARGGPLKLGQ